MALKVESHFVHTAPLPRPQTPAVGEGMGVTGGCPAPDPFSAVTVSVAKYALLSYCPGNM